MEKHRNAIVYNTKKNIFDPVLSLFVDLKFIQLVPGIGRRVGITFAAAVVSSIASVLIMYFISVIIASVIEGTYSEVIVPAGIAVFVTLIFRICSEMFRERSTHSTSALMKESVRSGLFKKLLQLGPSYTDEHDSGSLNTVFIEGTEQLEQYVAYYIPYLLLCILIPSALFIAFSLYVDFTTACILLVFVPLVPFSISVSNKKRKSKGIDVWKEFKAMAAYYIESLQALPTLKLFNQQKKRADEIHKISKIYGETYIRLLRTGIIVNFITDTVPYLGYGVALLYVCYKMSMGAMDMWQVMFVLFLGPVFYEHIIHLGGYYHNSINAKTTIRSIIEIIETEPKIVDPENTSISSLPSYHSIEFDNVTFGYGSDRNVLSNCSFKIEDGQTAALVGESGVGKSTVVDLLFRYYDAQRGTIKLSGIPIDNIPLDLLRKNMSVVSQDTYLFYGTVRDNLLFGNPNASDQQIQNAIEISCLDKFVKSLPNGLDTIVGERGMLLSGGERQRISIARAILKDAPVLILDEPTSSVDAESELYIRNALKKIQKGRTVLIIAHRLSTIRTCDNILVMENGTIKESGTHEQLMKTSGKYLELVQAQTVPEDA